MQQNASKYCAYDSSIINNEIFELLDKSSDLSRN